MGARQSRWQVIQQILAFAILAISSLPNGAPIATFRNHPLGAEGRANQLAGFFVEAAEDNNVEVWSLAAVAYTETRFDGTRIGRIGEVGMMQSNPRYAAGIVYIKARRNGWPQDALDVLSIHLGADALRNGLETCGEMRPRYAIGYYKSGGCRVGPAVRHVMQTRWKLMRLCGCQMIDHRIVLVEHAINTLIERYHLVDGTARHVLIAMQENIRDRRECVFICKGNVARPDRAIYVLNLCGDPCVAVYDERTERIVTFLPPRALFNGDLSSDTQRKIRILLGLWVEPPAGSV